MKGSIDRVLLSDFLEDVFLHAFDVLLCVHDVGEDLSLAFPGGLWHVALPGVLVRPCLE